MSGCFAGPHYDLVVVGGGMAAGRLLRQLHELNYTKTVAMVSLESCAGYNRVLLPGFLSGKYPAAELSTDEAWRGRQNFSVLADTTVREINLDEGTAQLDSGAELRFSKLVFATGSTVPRPEFSGSVLRNLFQLRSMADADNIRKVCPQAQHAVVIGGGLLGLEAADALNALGLKVSVVHRGAQLMNRQLDAKAGELLAQRFLDDGVAVKLGVQVAGLLGRDKVQGVRLDDGSELPADLVLLATGTIPNDQLARQAGIECERGICTDAQMQTNKPGVYALGECARVEGACYSLVEATHAQADTLAKTLCGNPSSITFAPAATRLKVSNTAVFSAGQTRPAQQANGNDVVVRDQAAGVYRRLLFSGRTLIGAVLMGDTDAAREITQRIGSNLDALERDRLVFGAG